MTTRREVGADAHMAGIRARRLLFAELHDFSQGRGLELGPLDSAIADVDVHDVAFVDVYDQAGTRELHGRDPNVLLELIPHIDYPLIVDGRTRSLAEAAAPGAPFDWLLASHVIEHVPDVIRWLAELGELAADGAALILAVPDRRYSFDRHRPQTTVGEALDAYLRGDTRPSTRAIYDHYALSLLVDTPGLWRGKRPTGRAGRTHDPATSREWVQRGLDGQYVDAHVWTFTPQSLIEQLVEFRQLGLVRWYVERIVERPGTYEFHAVLRHVPDGKEPADYGFEEVPLESDLPDWLEAEWSARHRGDVLDKQVRQLTRQVRTLKGELKAVRASRRMKLGSAIVRPASAVRRFISRRRRRRSLPAQPRQARPSPSDDVAGA